MEPWEVGDRIRDKFKKPRAPNDHSCTGEITYIDETHVQMKMDDDEVRELKWEVFANLFVKEDAS